MEYYKVLKNGKAKEGSNFDYKSFIKSGDWTPVINDLKLCSRGYHLTMNPFKWLDGGNQIFLVNGRGIVKDVDDKVVCKSIRFVRELSMREIKELSKKFSKIDFKRVRKDLGDIPTKNDVVRILKRVELVNWFKPLKPNKVEVRLKVVSILKAFKLDFSCKLSWKQLKTQKNWDSAWSSAWSSARDSAWNSAWSSARDSAWSSARDSAWDSAWSSAWSSAWDSAWSSARDSARDSAWSSARDSARASEFEVVKDLMKEKGYEQNPFSLLLELWEIGLYPIGLIDGKFVIYYVPLKKGDK